VLIETKLPWSESEWFIQSIALLFPLFHRVWLYKASDGPEFDEQKCEISKDVLLQVSNSQKY